MMKKSQEKLYKITEDEFWDNNKKGFFFTSNKTKNLIPISFESVKKDLKTILKIIKKNKIN